MTDAEREAIRTLFPDHVFLRVLKGDLQGIIALPKKQSTEEKEAAVALWKGATVRL